MPLTRQAKEDIVNDVKQRFARAMSTVFVAFERIDVNTITDLRARFRQAGVEYKVVKNELIRKALEGTPAGSSDLDKHLAGPTAVVWSYEDPSAGAKIIRDFRAERKKDKKDETVLQVKCGLLENKVMPGERVESDLANLPGKDEVRAMLLAQLQAPAQKLVAQLSAPLQNFAYVLDAYQRKHEGEQKSE
jgi:large subunit ribosomal protein L10